MNGSLFLTPSDPDMTVSDPGQLIAGLEALGLLTLPAQQDGSYLCGERFAQLITFMGCSPHLQFSPPADGSSAYCHIQLHQYATPQLLTGSQTAPPRCPACRFRISDWQAQLAGWQQSPGSTDWCCPKCGTVSPVSKLDWRQSGGCARLAVEVHNIFPGEAVPVDGLLAELKQHTAGKTWRYFYLV